MRIAAISDLHLGLGDSADRFGHRPEDFLTFLEHLEARHDLVVVVGDLYETWQGRRFGRTREVLDQIRRAYPRISGRVERPPYRIVSGNHDPIVADSVGCSDLEIEADGARVLFTHGHQWDPPIKKATPLAYTFCWTTGALNRMDGRGVARVRRIRDGFERRYLYNRQVPDAVAGDGPQACPYLSGATATLKKRPDLDVVVCGHTHVPARCETPFGTYLNCGSIAGGRWSWVELDTATRSWTLHGGAHWIAAQGD